MIGWYVDVGYCNSIPTNLNEIIITDKNKPHIIPQFTTTRVSGTKTIFNKTGDLVVREECAVAFEKTAPGYITWFYNFPTYTGSDYKYFLDLFPSSNLSWPNWWNFVREDSTAGKWLCVIYKSLKRVFMAQVRSSSSQSSNYRLGKILDNGSIEIISTSMQTHWYWNLLNSRAEGMAGGSVEMVMGLTSDFPGGDAIKNSKYWQNLLVRVTPTGIDNIGYLLMYWGGTSDNDLSLLFGDSSTPDIVGPPGPSNPYEPGGPSGPTNPGLPPGTFDDESDTITDSPLPTLSAANTGFTRIYNPTLSQVQDLARYLWTDESVIETIWNHIKQFFENPMEAIIGFNLVPVPVPDAGTENFALMYIDTGVSMTVAANQFVDLDCGTVELKRYYGSALDQSPYTKVSCFLPYIGTVNLNTDEVMGTTVQVKYRVDIVSGSCVAKIFVDGNCLYQYSGHCAITIPISSANFSSYVSAAISVGKLAAAAITAGAGVAMAGGVAEASQQTNQVVTTTQVTNTARNPSTGRQITTGTITTVQTRESPADQSSTQASFSGLSPQNVANTVGAIMSSKPHIEHSGSFSGNSGYLGVRRPFLIIERPNMCMPANYQALNGFPSMITMELSTCKGFTRVQQVQLTGMGKATNPEQAEIMELLKSGVIL